MGSVAAEASAALRRSGVEPIDRRKKLRPAVGLEEKTLEDLRVRAASNPNPILLLLCLSSRLRYSVHRDGCEMRSVATR